VTKRGFDITLFLAINSLFHLFVDRFHCHLHLIVIFIMPFLFESSRHHRLLPVRMVGVYLLLSILVLVTGRTGSSSSLNPANKFQRPLQYNKDVIKLTDKTFEHQTQASTGQTTGSWLVWFYITGDTTLIEGDAPDEEFWQSNNILLASVHGKLCKETIKRFDIQEFPQFIYFTKRKMYRYKGELTWDAITQFVLHGHNADDGSGGETVPPPRGELAKIIDTLRETMVGHLLIASFIFIMILFVIYARVVSQAMDPKKQKSH
jgi:hypothetical protein